MYTACRTVHSSILFMLTTTDAIVLSLQPHSDKAHILHAYTRTDGRVNYMVYGLGRKHSAGMYAPLSLLQITANSTPNRPASVRTAHLSFVPSSITTHPYKQTIALFLSEVLYHTLRHPMEDEALFAYIAQSVQLLDAEPEPHDFHLRFLIGLAERLGFAIDENTHPELYRTPHTRTERQQQLRQLCAYMEEHVDSWQSPRSLDVLMEVFD